jgi:hypothetical protein
MFHVLQKSIAKRFHQLVHISAMFSHICIAYFWHSQFSAAKIAAIFNPNSRTLFALTLYNLNFPMNIFVDRNVVAGWFDRLPASGSALDLRRQLNQYVLEGCPRGILLV